MKCKNLFFCVFFPALFCVSENLFAYLGGDGSAANPYQIASKADLLAMAADTGNYDKCFVLTADIDLTGESFTNALIAPDTSSNAGYQGTAFMGRFDGNYHIISNLVIDTLEQKKNYLGLFGYISNGTTGESMVIRLGLKNVSITAGNNSEIIGSLAGMSEQIIKSCYAKGSITCGSDSHIVGGLVGGNGSQILNSYADVDIYTGAYAADIGGFAGKAYGIFSNCYACGYIAGAAPATGGFGGSTLYGNWLIQSCYFLSAADGGGPNNGIGMVLTDSQMRQQNNFPGWDFLGSAGDGTDEVWLMDGGYPVLSWQVPVGMRQAAALSRYWQTTGCASGQPCEAADWYDDDVVDIKDLALLVQSWLGHGMKTDYPKTTDDFETGDFTKLPWVQSGTSGWTITSDSNVYQGVYSARSGVIGNSQSSTLEFTANVSGESEIVFAVKVSSESGFDGLNFYIDGSVRVMNLSGEYGWNEMRLGGFSTGVHTFKWSFARDGSGDGGSNCAWIDNVRILRIEN